jgi:hypothetical protein
MGRKPVLLSPRAAGAYHGGVTPYETACEAIDRANAADPRREEGMPREIAHARRRVEWVRSLAPSASEELLLASRAQHLARWTVPRETYPAGRAGYLRWREDLKKLHAAKAAEILEQAGYGPDPVAKVRTLLLRKNLAEDPEGQTLEDAVCLVFLEREFADFAAKTDGAKTVDILRKTWEKMSPAARERAKGLPYGPAESALLAKALGGG